MCIWQAEDVKDVDTEYLTLARILHHFMRVVYYNTHEITEVNVSAFI
jgi:hypothetical protein